MYRYNEERCTGIDNQARTVIRLPVKHYHICLEWEKMALSFFTMCLFNVTDYREYGALLPCTVSIDGVVTPAPATAQQVFSDCSLCNTAFRPSPPTYYVSNMPGAEFSYEMLIVDAVSGGLSESARHRDMYSWCVTHVQNTCTLLCCCACRGDSYNAVWYDVSIRTGNHRTANRRCNRLLPATLPGGPTLRGMPSMAVSTLTATSKTRRASPSQLWTLLNPDPRAT